MIVIDVRMNPTPAQRYLRAFFADQLPFAYARAINDSAKDGQATQRAHQRRVFEIRRPQFMDSAVKIKPFATKTTPWAKVMVDPPGGFRRADILTQHEDEDVKQPFFGRHLAVPTENVPRNGSGVITKAWRPRALFGSGSRSSSSIKSRGNVVRGARGTFLIMRGDRGTIFRRDEGGYKPLYWLVPRVPLDKRLQFVETVSSSVRTVFDRHMDRRFREAVRTAR